MSLLSRILTEIELNGPMPFERFMEIALYDADGFFGGETLRSEKAGDFLTSPEVSPLFGEAIGRLVDEVHAEIGDPFTLVEVGAGSGSLLRALLRGRDLDAVAVEVSAGARAALDGLATVRETLPERIRGVVLANELLDNLPMALAQKVEGEWRERWVGRDGDTLAFVDADPRPDVTDWLERYAGPVSEGGWVEVQLEARAWLSGALDRLDDGMMVLIDYGDTAENLEPRRRDGTLRTYRAHHLGPHPLDEPGATDITADVNFSALVDLAPSVLLERQDDFLTRLGLRERLRSFRVEELEAARRGDEMERLRLRSLKTEAETLLHPRGLGDFRVLTIRVGTAHMPASS